MAETDRDQGFLKRLGALFSVQKPTRPTKTTEPIPKAGRDSIASWSDLSSWYQSAMGSTSDRKAKYRLYKFLDENLGEASTALNIYADNIVSGTVGGEETYYVYIEEGSPDKEGLEKLVEDFEKRTGIKDQIWDVSRDLTRDGDLFQEPIIEDRNGQLEVAKFKDLPTDEMFYDCDERGVLKNPDFPYYQTPSLSVSTGMQNGRIPFEWWRVIHYKIGRRDYGVDRSIFANASKRIGRQLIMVDDALVLARLSRAVMRYIFKVDVQGIPPADRFEYVQKFMNQIKRKEVVDASSGKINIIDAPWGPDDDIGIPTEAGIDQGVSALGGDTNITNIADVTYLRDKFYGIVTIPKAYAALEEGTRSKATLDQIDIQFGRQVRRKQNALIPGLKRAYELEFYLHGINPDSFKWTIEFPELATSDEELKWSLLQTKSAVAQAFVLNLGVLNNNWILQEVLGFDDDEIKRYGILQQQPPPEAALPGAEGSEYIPTEIKKRILRDPLFRTNLEDLRDIVETKLARERRLEGKVPIGTKRSTR